jgi:hypothetical protein
MADAIKFEYTQVRSQLGEVALRPLLPLTLIHDHRSIDVLGLVDSGGDINILPHHLGKSLGLQWEQCGILPTLGGALGQLETRAVVLMAKIEPFSVISIGFGWSVSDNSPLILGRTNFFQLFSVCFFAGQNIFEIQPK